MKKIIIALLLSAIFIGCQTTKVSSHMYYRELSEYKARMRIEGTELIVDLENRPGLMVYELQHKHEEERILVGAHRISSGGGKKEYRINLSFHTLPANIAERIYWVDPDGTTHQLHPQYL